MCTGSRYEQVLQLANTVELLFLGQKLMIAKFCIIFINEQIFLLLDKY